MKRTKVILLIGALVVVVATAAGLPFANFGLKDNASAQYDIKANFGQIMLGSDAPAAMYTAAGGTLTKYVLPPSSLVWKYDNDFSYIVQECKTIDGQLWLGLFIGSKNSGWIKYEAIKGVNPKYPFNPAKCS
jgi:hypothetical protein